jgi:hypothetical protein
MIKKTKIICATCNKEHEIRLSDYKRKIKNGQDKLMGNPSPRLLQQNRILWDGKG